MFRKLIILFKMTTKEYFLSLFWFVIFWSLSLLVPIIENQIGALTNKYYGTMMLVITINLPFTPFGEKVYFDFWRKRLSDRCYNVLCERNYQIIHYLPLQFISILLFILKLRSISSRNF